MAQLTIDYENIVGDALISAGTIAYAGAFTPKFRVSLVQEWQGRVTELKIPLTPGCDLASVMGNPVEVRSLNNRHDQYLLSRLSTHSLTHSLFSSTCFH